MSDLVSQSLSMTFTTPAGGQVHALKDINFTLREGEILAVLGPSGCGKTTLLNIISGFLRPSRSSKVAIPRYDFLLAQTAGLTAIYLAWDYEGIIERAGLPIERDVVLGAILICLLLEAARRALGPPLPTLAGIFLLYAYFGPWMPAFVAHPGSPVEAIVEHMYLSDSGVWGVPIGVSAEFVFLFVLFGSLLERAGAANYFVQVAFAALGQFRGGPAKAAVVASGMTGLVSGSSIANVATTGTFTIPLMKKVGFRPQVAGALENSVSLGGQLLPPVMGSGAFVMAEITGVPYVRIMAIAAVPALLYFFPSDLSSTLRRSGTESAGWPRRTFAVRWRFSGKGGSTCSL